MKTDKSRCPIHLTDRLQKNNHSSAHNTIPFQIQRVQETSESWSYLCVKIQLLFISYLVPANNLKQLLANYFLLHIFKLEINIRFL